MKLYSLLICLLAATVSLNAQTVTAERIANLTPENYSIDGDAILRAYDDGTLELSLTDDFDTPNGPDVRIFLGTSLSLTGAVEIVDLSNINHFSGAYSTNVPEGIDIEDYDYVLFFCVAFQQFWASGQLGTTTFPGGGFECLASTTAGAEGTPTVSVCPTDDEAVVIFTNSINAAAGANYAYLITDENNALLQVVTTNSANFAGSGPATQRVYGLSYSGELNAPIGANRLQTTASECTIHSSGTEFLTVLKDGCGSNYECRDQATATTNWVSEVSICTGDGEDDVVELRNSLSIAPGEHYAYLITMENETLLEVVYDTFYNFEAAGTANFRVYGINYDGELDAQVGTNRLATTATGCFTHSSADLYLSVQTTAACPSATFDMELAQRIKTYPVPASSLLKIDLPANFSARRLTVTDLTGRVVLAQSISAAGNNLQIDVATLVTGTYFLQLWGDEKAVTKRFAVARNAN